MLHFGQDYVEFKLLTKNLFSFPFVKLRNCNLEITMEKIVNDSIVLSNESIPKPELTQRRRRFEERMDQREIDNEIDYLEELSDRIQH